MKTLFRTSMRVGFVLASGAASPALWSVSVAVSLSDEGPPCGFGRDLGVGCIGFVGQLCPRHVLLGHAQIQALLRQVPGIMDKQGMQ